MVAALGLVAAAVALAASLSRSDPVALAQLARPVDCGLERWPEKTFADPFASAVKLTPKKTTVAALRKLPKVVGIGGMRGLGTERTVFRVKALLVGVKQEADSDFHLVIADPVTRKTMIVEFPNQSCTLGAAKKIRARMQKARVAVVTSCGFAPNSDLRPLAGKVTITGVGFFDFPHKQTGHAPNDLELHPVLAFSGKCD